MSKVTITTIANLQNESAAVGSINRNFTALQTIIETLLSRDGLAPNQMVALLDMNNQRIINLPVPVNDTEPARHGDLQGYVTAAEAAQEAAEAAQAGAEEAEALVEDIRDDFVGRYLGSLATDPTVDELNRPVELGAWYYNTTFGEWRVYVEDVVYVNSDSVLDGTAAVIIDYWQIFPTVTLASMNDVNITDIVDGQILQWNAGTSEFEPANLSADLIAYDNTSSGLDADTMQSAIDEISTKATLDKYDLCFYIEGLLSEAETLFRILVLHKFEIAVDAAYSAYVDTPPSSDQTLYLKKNGVQFATITFLSGENTGTMTISGTIEFDEMDRFEIYNQAVPDTAARDFSVSIAARRV